MPGIKRDFFRFLDNHPAASVVCFDFFDTLVYRTVAPEHTKQLASNQLGQLLAEEPCGADIYRMRRDLEAELCGQNASEGGDPEFSLTAFAAIFYGRLKQRFSGWPDFLTIGLFSDTLMAIEIKVETLVQRVFSDTAEILQRVRERGFRTVIVSDFYIQSPFFKRLLDFHDFAGQVDGMFISSDYGLTKASGRLYEKLVDGLGCAPENLLMIGDNEHSDVRMAEASGIRAFHVDRQRQKAFYNQWSLGQGSRQHLQKEVAEKISAAVKQQGGGLFPETGATLWRFTGLLFRRLLKDRVKDVFFFSKEGEFLKKLFEQYQEEQFGGCVIRAHYLMVSRKSTFICSLKPLEEENFYRLFHQYRSIAPRDFLLSLNLPEDEAADLCRGISIDFERRLTSFGTSAAFIAIISSPRFAELYENRRREQKKNFLGYLDAFGVDIHNEGLHIVDVGWKGSIQDNIFFSLDEKVVVKGYYIGLLQPGNISQSNCKAGILFSEHPVETPFFEVYNSNRSFFEMILDATHGSADGYCSAAGDPPGCSTASASTEYQRSGNADIYVKTLDLPEERRLFAEYIQPIQGRILGLCREINRLSVVTDSPPPEAEWFARRHARMVYRPTAGEVDFFETLYHLENFGIFEFTAFSGGKRLSWGRRIRNLIKIFKDPGSVLATGIWAPVVLNRLGLKHYRRYFGAQCHRRVFADGYYTWNLRQKEKARKRRLRFQPKRDVKIAFLLGIPDINGGTYVIFEHASRMKHKGYQVFILTEDRIDPRRYAWHPEAAALKWLTFREAMDLHFDFAIATWWMSTFRLRDVTAATYLYFVQSIETRFFPAEDQSTYEALTNLRLAEKSYLLPLPVVTEARWIQTYLRENGSQATSLVLNGIRKEIYTASGECHAERRPGKLRVLVEGPLGVAYKNVERSIELCRASDADEVWLLTSSAVDAFPGVDRVFSQVPIWETPPVYRSCDVLVKLSYVEGMFGPPLEMFHCGGTAIVYDVTGHDEYIRHDVNSFVVRPDDEAGVVGSLNLLKREPDVLNRLKKGARETAFKWPDWEASSDSFEKALDQLKIRLWPNRNYLSRVTDQMRRQAQHEVERLKSLPFYRESRPARELCQIFWHGGGQFSEADSLTIDYQTGGWVSIKTRLPAPGPLTYLRIDPCMQMGVIFFEHILIQETRHDRFVCRCRPDTGWQGVDISGTAAVIRAGARLIVESNGADPQCILAPFNLDGGDIEIVVDVSMRFLPFPLALGELRQEMGDREDGVTGISAH